MHTDEDLKLIKQFAVLRLKAYVREPRSSEKACGCPSVWDDARNVHVEQGVHFQVVYDHSFFIRQASASGWRRYVDEHYGRRLVTEIIADHTFLSWVESQGVASLHYDFVILEANTQFALEHQYQFLICFE